VIDVGLPDIGGLELQAQVAAEHAEIAVIVTAACADAATIVRAMKAGAVDFLIKPVAERLALEAIGSAIERSCSTVRDQRMLEELRVRHDALTCRERQVMKLVASGLLNKQIAGELGISEITVKAHRGRAMEKMRARSLADLVKMCGRLGMA
jgi:FixJ family two-component response regulator